MPAPEPSFTTKLDLKVNHGNNLRLKARRLFNYLLLKAFNTDALDSTYLVKHQELSELFEGVPSANTLRETFVTLGEVSVEVSWHEEGEHYWGLTPLFQIVYLAGDRFSYQFSPLCQRIFQHPKYLEQILLQAYFSGKYSNALYQPLANRYFSGQSQYRVNINEIRDSLCLPNNKLSNFADFSRFVLAPSLNEINAHASFKCHFDTIRIGRKVTELVFTFQDKLSESPAMNQTNSLAASTLVRNQSLDNVHCYCILLNVAVIIRGKLFEQAKQISARQNEILPETWLDHPELWLHWLDS
ncbi:replication initiation protein [Vibrio profundum]|uniref:replication initiation protein n=1 Tax=Vibrio profundum TaxID=2910247 RepID=UPI003D09D45D